MSRSSPKLGLGSFRADRRSPPGWCSSQQQNHAQVLGKAELSLYAVGTGDLPSLRARKDTLPPAQEPVPVYNRPRRHATGSRRSPTTGQRCTAGSNHSLQEQATMARREFDVVVWGASGFTGQLVSEYLASQYG